MIVDCDMCVKNNNNNELKDLKLIQVFVKLCFNYLLNFLQRHLKIVSERTEMLYQIGSNMLSGKKAKKKYKGTRLQNYFTAKF